jgi:hypothetical protein
MAIVEGIAAAKAAFEVSKVVLDLTRFPKLDIDTIHARLLELQGLILSAQMALGDLGEENRQLSHKLDDREALKELAKSLVFGYTVYWRDFGEESYDGPYCPTCWDADRKLIRLSFWGEDMYGGVQKRRHDCPIHGYQFFIDSHVFQRVRLQMA